MRVTNEGQEWGTKICLINCLKGHKSLRTLGADPETLTEWNSESVTYGHLTWVGARDTCVSKNSCITVPWLHSISLFVGSYMEGWVDCKDHVTILWVIFYVVIIVAIAALYQLQQRASESRYNFVDSRHQVKATKKYLKNKKTSPKLLGLAHFKYPWMHSLQDFQIPASPTCNLIFSKILIVSRTRMTFMGNLGDMLPNLFHIDSYKGEVNN